MRHGQRVVTAVGIAGLLAVVAFALVVPEGYNVAGSLVWVCVGVLPMFALGVWLACRRPDHPQARRLLLTGSALAVGVGLEGPLRLAFLAPEAPAWLLAVNLLSQYVGLVAMVAGGVLVATYPDGVVERRWQHVTVRALWASLALPPLLLLTSPVLVVDVYLLDSPPTAPSPVAVGWLAPLGPPLAELFTGYYLAILGPGVLLARYAVAEPRQQRRMQPLLYAMAVTVIVMMAGNGLRILGVPDDAAAARVVGVLALLVMLALPLAIVFGVLRHRLFEIDLVVRRSVAYGALTVGIAAAYVALAAAPGLTLGNQIPVELAVLITVGAAVAVQPLRRRLEALADRWIFGTRINRYKLLTDFGAGLEQTVDLAQLLPRLADTVRTGLAAAWVRVSVPGAEATAGDPAGDAALTVPLHDGRIECGPKDGGYDAADRELLTTLAGQAATAIANLRLTAALADRLDELAASRARIVVAADTERRRIERDIHDGVQQHVVALITKIRLARNALARGQRPGDEVLGEVQTDARALLADLRELAHGIHPPVLSDRGLVAAIEARADRLPVPVQVHADDGLRDRRFGAELEAAAYYVVCEALTNVVKHAAATSVDVELSNANGTLAIMVRDDGIGACAPQTNGHGLTNLRDRVEALCGSLRVQGRPGAGTCLTAELPVGGRGG